MSDMMAFPETVEEFMEAYKVVDDKQVYSNGTEYVPIFRMRQWFEHIAHKQQEPCEDTISRQAAIDALGEEPPVWYDGEDEIAERDQWRRDVAAIKALPSAEPKRPSGKWLSHNDYCKKHGYIPSGLIVFWWCDQCEQGTNYSTNFCPNCGADMRGDSICK